MQRGNYERKLEAMRAYAKTPAGMASKKASQIKWLAKRKECAASTNTLLINPHPLLIAVAKWKTK